MIGVRSGCVAPIKYTNSNHYLNAHHDVHLSDEPTPLFVDKILDPQFSLQDIALTAIDIERFQGSFITTRLQEPGTQLCPVDQKPDLSQAKIRCISRGFWQRQLFCEKFIHRARGTVAVEYVM